jgi:hypothetical protein
MRVRKTGRQTLVAVCKTSKCKKVTDLHTCTPTRFFRLALFTTPEAPNPKVSDGTCILSDTSSAHARDRLEPRTGRTARAAATRGARRGPRTRQRYPRLRRDVSRPHRDVVRSSGIIADLVESSDATGPPGV